MPALTLAEKLGQLQLPAVAGDDATISAKEARRSGIHWTFAPMIDVTHGVNHAARSARA